MTEIIIDEKFCGPRAFANGGYAAGRYAQMIGGPAAVTLKAPSPFATPIRMVLKDETARLYAAVAKGQEIAIAEPAEVSFDAPPLPSDEAIAEARETYLNDDGMTLYYPYCFVCGKRCEDGLHVFAGPAQESAVNADFWTPSETLADDDGLVRPEYLWAALDCPGAFALRLDGGMVLLGRFAVDILRRPAPGERLIVAAWKTGQEGRKHFSSSALYDENREMIAAANAVWIELNDPAMIERLKAENA